VETAPRDVFEVRIGPLLVLPRAPEGVQSAEKVVEELRVVASLDEGVSPGFGRIEEVVGVERDLGQLDKGRDEQGRVGLGRSPCGQCGRGQGFTSLWRREEMR
jgi:hypothetical protein